MKHLLLYSIFILNNCTMRSVVVKKTIFDLTHSFDKQTIYWPSEQDFKHEKEYYGYNKKGYFYSSYRLCSAEHGGTHIDAPIHFNEKGQTLDELALSRLIGPGAVVDVRAQSAKNRDYQVSIDDLKAWEAEHHESLFDKIILINTGFAHYWPDRLLYLGTNKRGIKAIEKLHFPGLSETAAQFLVKERRIRAVGIDTASIDYGQSTLFKTHRILFEFNTPAFENVSNLNSLPASGFEIIALPMKIKDGSGGPLRIIALVPDSSKTPDDSRSIPENRVP